MGVMMTKGEWESKFGGKKIRLPDWSEGMCYVHEEFRLDGNSRGTTYQNGFGRADYWGWNDDGWEVIEEPEIQEKSFTDHQKVEVSSDGETWREGRYFYTSEDGSHLCGCIGWPLLYYKYIRPINQLMLKI